MKLHGRHATILIMPRFQDPTACIACPRLAEHLSNIRQRDPDWHALPVPAFGSLDAELLVVGLGQVKRALIEPVALLPAMLLESCSIRHCIGSALLVSLSRWGLINGPTLP
jgi:hypothetical protein